MILQRKWRLGLVYICQLNGAYSFTYKTACLKGGQKSNAVHFTATREIKKGYNFVQLATIL